jgi:arylsulfatase A
MKTILLHLICLLECATAATRPSFVLILADDMGWNDAAFTGNRFIETPNLDGLAREGMQFTEACASAPNCAPTRACLLTGQYPPRHGVYTVVDPRHAPGSLHHRLLAAESREALPTESVTLAEALRTEGYATGMFGMWNLGRGRSGPATPTGQGFDVFSEPKHLGFEKDAYRNTAGAYSPDALTDAALKWIESVRAKPFFLYLAFHDVHAPFDPKPVLLEKYQRRHGDGDPAFAATVEAMDANVGRVMACLKRLGILETTYVIFTSDNGGSRHTVAPLRGGKGTLYQGGLRVPAVIRGPGIKPSKSDAVMLSMDWYPTVLELAGRKPTESVDGQSLVPLLRDPSAKLERHVFWHFPCYVGGSGPCSAIRIGDWKLIEFFESGTSELYHLRKDPGESEDLTDTERARAGELLARLRGWQAATGAPRPTSPNPAFRPELVKKPGTKGREKNQTRKQP